MTNEEFQEFNSAGRMIDIMTANDTVFSGNARAAALKTELLADIAVLETAGASRVSASGLRSDGTNDSIAA